jgi:hypothetical protein
MRGTWENQKIPKSEIRNRRELCHENQKFTGCNERSPVSTLGDMAKNGSVTIYIQHESPGADKESNWLPAPKDGFNLFMRLYWPKKEILNGTWKMPPVKQEGARPKTEAA